ncbi:MAG: tetratricopeptide repeat protein [Candidatus Lambdaproteobacteria bacterium]|nr:tetratricopeptide repeat protein [Candidatus Lambdaproteobacteria bacterium]
MHRLAACACLLTFAALLGAALLGAVLPTATPLAPSAAAQGGDEGEMAETLFRAGQRELREGKAAAAEAAWQNALVLDPGHVNAHLALAALYLPGNPAAAAEHLEHARELRPASDQIHYLLGEALEAEGKVNEAMAAYRQAIHYNAANVVANRRLRGILRRLRAQQGVIERASEAFWGSPSLATLTLFGQMLLREGESQQALAELEEIRSRLPALPEVNLWIARVHRREGSLAGEIEAYRAYLAQQGRSAAVRLALVQRLLEAHHYREADRALVPLLAPRGQEPPRLDKPEQGRTAFLHSRLLAARGQIAEVGSLLLAASALDHEPAAIAAAFAQDTAAYPGAGSLWLALARWRQGRDQMPGAIDALRRAGLEDARLRGQAREALHAILAAAPGQTQARLALGELALAQGDRAGALAQLERIPAGDHADARAALLQGLIYRGQGDLERSLDAFLRYVFAFPDRGGMTYARGNLAWEIGNRAAAVAIWQERPDVLVDYPDALGRLAEQLQASADSARELDARQRLREATPQDLVNRERLGALLLQAKRAEEALQEWAYVADQRPGDFDLLTRIAELHLERGDLDAAMAALRRAEQVQELGLRQTELLARYLHRQGNAREALPLYWQVYQAQPDHPDLPAALPELVLKAPATAEMRLVAARMAESTGRAAVAIELLEDLLRLHPETEDARTRLAGLYLAQNLPEEAERVLAPLGGQMGGGAPARLAMLRMVADAQQRLGRRAALAVTLEQLQALEPANLDYRLRRGLLLVDLERYAEAVPLLTGVTIPPPEASRVRWALALGLARLERRAEAIAQLEAALMQDADLAPARKLMIDLLLAERRWQALPPHLEWWIAHNPTDDVARYNLVTAYLRLFDAAAARPHYLALLRINPARARSLALYFK